jgi:diguanylate cyclase (GGDEF)-like protein
MDAAWRDGPKLRRLPPDHMNDMGEPRRDTSGVTTRVVVLYVKQHGGDQAVAALLESAGETRSLDELLDEHGWSSYEQKIRLFRAAVEVLGDPGAVRRIGQSMLRSRIALPLLVLLRALGSPEQVLRNVAKANSRFSTNSTVQALEIGNGHAVVAYRLHEGYVPDPLDCQYTEGLLSLVPEVFGLPPATVRHNECQVHGAPACLYRVRWRPRHRWFQRVRAEHTHLRDQLDAITQRFQELQSVAADLVSTEDVSTVLARIATRASHAVRAPRYLLAARATEDSPLRVYHQGFTEEEASTLGERLIRGEPLEHIGSWLVADITSARCRYGKLGAVYAQHEPFFPEERQLLVAYARQAAAALDAATALEEARRRHATSRALLQLAHALANLASPDEVAERIAAAVPDVVTADRSTVNLWDPATQRLSTAATHGWPPELEPMVEMFSVRPSDTSELADMLTDSQPRCYRRGSTDDPFLEGALERFGLSSVAVVPIVARGEFFGIVTAATAGDSPPLDFHHDTSARLGGLANQAAAALSNARLLAQERATLAELRRSEAQVKHQAAHDALTGLANRVLFNDQLRTALKRGVGVAVLFVDLDDFKAVNDRFGHAAGDDLLTAVAGRLAACMRSGDTVARLGGDEFAVLLEGADELAAVQTAERLIGALAAPLALPGTTVTVEASVGIAIAPRGTGDVGGVLRNADVAMYAAKEAGKGRFAVFEPGMHTRTLDRIEQEHELREALDRDQFVLRYQPIIELASGQPVGVEALVRWQHPTRGLLPPSEFIPRAETTGLIVALGRSILDKACAQAARWRGDTELRLGVNLSARQLTDPGLFDDVVATLSATQLPADRLVLEITETALLNNAPDRVLMELREVGVRIALDDFGTGYSSLEHLRRFPVDAIKIDKAFINHITGGLRESALARAIVQLGQTMGLATVAEGVETADQAVVLRELGCGYGQGYWFAKPMTSRSLERYIDQPQPAWHDRLSPALESNAQSAVGR